MTQTNYIVIFQFLIILINEKERGDREDGEDGEDGENGE